MSANLVATLILGPMALAGVLALVLDAFGSRRAAIVLAGIGALAGGVAAVATAGDFRTAWGVLRIGGTFASVSAIIGVLAALAILGGYDSLSRRDSGGSLAALMALGAAASVGIACSRDVTLLLISVEAAAICAYTLVAVTRTRRAQEAAFKYFVQGAVATGMFVFGLAVLVTVFAPTGDLNLLAKSLEEAGSATIAFVPLVLILAALAFKAGAVPFHSWAPDAYETASPESAAYLSAGPKLAAITAFGTLVALAATPSMEVPLATVTGALAILSVLVGSVAALRQRSYTRMLGYAGVAQVGYALIALCALHRPTAAAFLIATYAVASTGTFLAAAAVRRVRPEWDGSTAGMAGMARRAPVLSAGLAVLVISLAGIPPLLGFWGKFAVFLSVAGAAGAAFTGGATGVGWLYVIAGAMGIIGSVVSLGYYGSVLRALYLLPEPIVGQPAAAEAHEAGDPGAPSAPEGVGTATWAVLIAASIVVVLGVLPVVAGWSAILGWIG